MNICEKHGWMDSSPDAKPCPTCKMLVNITPKLEAVERIAGDRTEREAIEAKLGALLDYLYEQFPATVGHTPLFTKLSSIRNDVFCALQSRDAENARLNERVRELEAALKTIHAGREKAWDDRDRLSAELARVKKAAIHLRNCSFWQNDCPEWVDDAIAEAKGEEK